MADQLLVYTTCQYLLSMSESGWIRPAILELFLGWADEFMSELTAGSSNDLPYLRLGDIGCA